MKYLSLYACLSLLIACAGSKKVASSSSTGSLVADGKLWSSLFQQKAAEYKALCLQAYNVARLRLDETLMHRSSKPKAVITDIDETFLDNSPYAVIVLCRGKTMTGHHGMRGQPWE